MDLKPICNLYDSIRNHNIIKHKKRQEFLCDLIEGIVRSRSVIISEIADKIDRDIKKESIERRIQDFFSKVNFNYEQLAKILCCLVRYK